MPFITEKAYVLFALLAIPAFFKDFKKTIFVIALCFVAIGVGDLSGNILKHLFERPRPCQSLENVRLLVGCGKSFSLPSNHAVNAFAFAATFSHFFKRNAIPMFLIASAVAFSRIYVGVHYPSDVIAGAIWGGIIVGLILLLFKCLSRKAQ